VWILQNEIDLAPSFKRIKKMGRLPFHYERPIFPLLLKQLLQKQRYTTTTTIQSAQRISDMVAWLQSLR
jgi:hypothetical protein